jgi:succinate dehydrogenase / fumarate reductase iron-sulfur subunit
MTSETNHHRPPSRSASSARTPGKQPHWERHRIPYEANLNVISVLQKIAAQATTEEGKKPLRRLGPQLLESLRACTMP